MASMQKEQLGLILAFIGFLGDIIVCYLPRWKVKVFTGPNILTQQMTWEGLWMTCLVQSTGQMQCKMYKSLLELSQDLKNARVLIVISIVVAFIGILLTVARCTNCIKDEMSKVKVTNVISVTFILAAVFCLIPLYWTTNTFVKNFNNPLNNKPKELGAAIYIGWWAAALLIMGGVLFCSSCPPKKKLPYNAAYSQAIYTASSKAYV